MNIILLFINLKSGKNGWVHRDRIIIKLGPKLIYLMNHDSPLKQTTKKRFAMGMAKIAKAHNNTRSKNKPYEALRM